MWPPTNRLSVKRTLTAQIFRIGSTFLLEVRRASPDGMHIAS